MQALDQRTDLFALGALGHWLLTGTQAYRASHLVEALPREAREAAAPYASILGGLSSGLRERLGEPARESPLSDPVQDRSRKQEALQQWLSSLSEYVSSPLLPPGARADTRNGRSSIANMKSG